MSATTEQVVADNADDSDVPSELSPDQAYHLLQNDRRRAVLRYLHGETGRVDMRDIAEQVAAWENDTTVQALSSDERQRVYIPLYQSHLPKLDEEGVINYDQSRGVVEKTELVETLNGYLSPSSADDEDDEQTNAWERYYLGASGVGTTMLAGAVLNVIPFAWISGSVVGAFVLGMFWLLTLGQRFGGG